MSNELIEQYATCAKRHGHATISGDSSAANAAHDDLYAVFRELKKSGNLACLEPLLRESDVNVRCWAATHYLLVDERRATKALKALSKGSGMAAFDAEMVLAEWKAGRLEFPE